MLFYIAKLFRVDKEMLSHIFDHYLSKFHLNLNITNIISPVTTYICFIFKTCTGAQM